MPWWALRASSVTASSEAVRRVDAGDDGDELTAAREQALHDLAGHGELVGADDDDVAVDDAEHVARPRTGRRS